ncbi:thiamine pyrophosphate-dependent enzyme [Propionimicrobium sp. PCR01-08-3]|uniref:thiamine pyrophosphate-dependent enzyme n=1 Tax=Propionimicrobium sp. PCR01-08-3 TaxID=3052086 RepID=UPI00255C84C6|nr:thiamine pyrophosphate-dependent enzyme [Propionimicrobium sp. PCR01-08-3]WIY82691.1 thiamine pyrophosphate-dependent enzyme [Propionimicrobium sp. PCR01-08-3]
MNTAMSVGWPTAGLAAQSSRFQPPQPVEEARVQLLREDGTLLEDPDFAPVCTGEQAAQMLRDMTLIRRFDTESTALQRKGQLGLWAPGLGQEAIQVAAVAALGQNDHVFPSHRETGMAMLMGLPIERLLGIFCGKETGDWDSEETRFHHLNMVIGGHTLHGVGYAMGQARDRQTDPNADDGVSVILHGDGAISEGDVNEAYIFAAAYQAPAVFVCVNNQWAISEPAARQSQVPLYQRAWGFGIPSVQVDGNDVLAMHAAMTWALERARSGQGPSFIEAYTYRMGAHTTSDDPTKYRTRDESAEWEIKDPLTRTEAWLRSEGLWEDSDQARLDQEAEAFGEQVRDAVNNVVTPKLEDIFDRVYAAPTPDLVAQRDQVVRELAAL